VPNTSRKDQCGFTEAAGAADSVRLLRNWRAEKNSETLYRALARLAASPADADLYQRLADAEARHAYFWEQRLLAAAHALPPFRPSLRTAFSIRLARHLGVGFVVPSLVVTEMKDRDAYADQDDAQAAGLAHDENDHASALRGGAVHHSLSNRLRAAVLGANDGLASNLCLMAGVAGGGASPRTLLLTGISGLLGGALSMALGEWLSVTNARELASSQLDRPSGMGTRERVGAAQPASDAVSAAGYSFVFFALGATVPLLPFGLLSGWSALVTSLLLSLAALFGLGVATSLFNARLPLFSGLRQTCIGAAAAAATYGAGIVFTLLAPPGH
jgi:vacuolar iron transporter family protein